MGKRKLKIYSALQLGGWASYIVLGAFLTTLTGSSLDKERVITLLSVFVIGVILSHLGRNLMIRLQWTKLRLSSLIPRAILASLVFAVVFELLFELIQFAMGSYQLNWVEVIQNTLNWAILALIWSLIYFVYHYFENYQREEIKNLKWEAAKKEIELNKLKSQLNPHFIFNSMNTIRALVDENPKKAKRSITQLSNILRNSLLMGKKELVTLSEELQIVDDYLDIEKARFEERLNCVSNISEESRSYMVPLLMVQTLVENGIKHGVSKLPAGGTIYINTAVEDDCLIITIENTGTYNHKKPSETGFGLVNTRQRLNLLFGEEASLEIKNVDDETVCTRVVIPSS